MQCEMKCQKVKELGIICGERPFTLCHQKREFLLYLSVGTEGRKILTQKFRDITYDLSTLKY